MNKNKSISDLIENLAVVCIEHGQDRAAFEMEDRGYRMTVTIEKLEYEEEYDEQ